MNLKKETRVMRATKIGHYRRLVVVAVMVSLSAILFQLAVPPGAAQAVSSVGGAISRAEVIARAWFWIDEKVMYSQNGTYPDPQGKPYRRDCSGMVSMSWHLDTTGTWLNGGYNTDQFEAWGGKTNIGWSQLLPGDAVLSGSYGHVALFEKWVDSAHTRLSVLQENQTGTPAKQSQVTLSWYQGNGFHPIRYNKITNDGSGGEPTGDPIRDNVSDVSGDGHADLLATKPDGTLWYYPNNSDSNPGHLPFTTGTQIGTGWEVFDSAHAADVSGDGHADVLAIKPDGTLWYYPNNSSTNPGNLPFTTGTQIGTGWEVFNSAHAADISGDGHADLVATKPDGTLWYYPNNSDSNPGHVPFISGTQIGTGWQAFTTVSTADVSGDGHADILATKPDGTLWYYPNNSDSNPGHLPFTTGTQIGTGWEVFNWVHAADVSGDGHADLLATKPDGTLWYYPNNSDSNPGHLPFTTGTQIGTGWEVFDRVF
jgi:hypothetical protein